MANLRRLIDLDKIKPIEFPSTEMDGLDVVRYLNTLPTVDAVEVVHGRWENEQIGFMYYDAICSACKSHNNSASRYCPHCGAKMDGVNDA